MFKWAAGMLVGHGAGVALLEMFSQLCKPEPEDSQVTRGNAVMWGGCDPGGCDPLSETCGVWQAWVLEPKGQTGCRSLPAGLAFGRFPHRLLTWPGPAHLPGHAALPALWASLLRVLACQSPGGGSAWSCLGFFFNSSR